MFRAANARLRFLPRPWFFGDADPLTVRALDGTFAGAFTAGATRQTVNTSPGVRSFMQRWSSGQVRS